METENHGRVGGVTVSVGIEDNGRREEGIGGSGGGTGGMDRKQGLFADSAEKG